MELENIKTQTTWSDAAESINSNNLKIITEVTKLQGATYKNKGYFKTLADLQSAYPNAGPGSKAYIGVSYPYAIYLWENNSWVDSGVTGGEESVNLEQFYTKDETNSRISALENETNIKLAELAEEFAQDLAVAKNETNIKLAELANEFAQDLAFVKNDIETLKNEKVFLTEAEYDSLEEKDEAKLYFVFEK